MTSITTLYQKQRAESPLAFIPAEHLQRALLVTAIACAVISLIPSLGFAGSLTLRSVAGVTAGIHVLNGSKKELPLNMMRVASIALGIASIATQVHFLALLSIGIEGGLQMFGIGKSVHDRKLFESCCQAGLLCVTAFSMAAMFTGAWPYMVTAAAVNSAVMLLFAVKAGYEAYKKSDPRGIFDVVCYVALMGVGIAASVRAAELTSGKPVEHRFWYKNTFKDETHYFYDKHGNLLAEVKPGETVDFKVNHDDVVATERLGAAYLYVEQGGYKNRLHSVGTDCQTIVSQAPMTLQEFPTLPVGEASVLVTQAEPKKRELEKVLEEYLKPELGPTIPFKVHDETLPTITLNGELFNLHAVQTHSQLLKNIHEVFPNQSFDDIPEPVMCYLREEKVKLGRLKEEELFDRYYQILEYGLGQLEKIFLQEFASRLSDLRWKDLSLLQGVCEGGDCGLKRLVSLINFSERGGS